MYARYNPKEKKLFIEYIVSNDKENKERDYIPSEAEKSLIIDMIEEKCQECCHCSVSEFLLRG